MSLTQAEACLGGWCWCWCWWWWRVLLFLPPQTPSLCPADGCQLECSVTGLFLDDATWNTPTEASLRINTSCSRAVWHVWPEFCSDLTSVFLAVFFLFFFLFSSVSSDESLRPCSALAGFNRVVRSSEGTWSSWDVSWRSWGRTEVKKDFRSAGSFVSREDLLSRILEKKKQYILLFSHVSLLIVWVLFAWIWK